MTVISEPLVAVDTNILIYAQFDGYDEHKKCVAALDEILSDSSTTMVLSVQVLQEFIHIATDARRFSSPLTMSSALSLAREYLDRTNVKIIHPDEVDLQNCWALMEIHKLGRNRLSDTLLATCLRRAKVSLLLTRNTKDFRIFPFIRCKDPTASDSE